MKTNRIKPDKPKFKIGDKFYSFNKCGSFIYGYVEDILPAIDKSKYIINKILDEDDLAHVDLLKCYSGLRERIYEKIYSRVIDLEKLDAIFKFIEE